MAEQLLDQVRDVVEGQIDFEGQKLAEILATALLSIAGAISFLVGFFLQDIALALKIGLGGTALTFLLVVPPWPFFNRHPVQWLPVGGGSAVTSIQQNIIIDEKLLARQ
ncbi:microsomal signal peptidase 12kDa subunit [Biscogniauxia sp. FL1348]|nr:microsomal signal peptidase 12kDa subunit [Biscogniauxia sp. FL1348]